MRLAFPGVAVVFPLYFVVIGVLAYGALSTPGLAQTPAVPPVAIGEGAELAPPEWVVTCTPGNADPAKTTCQMEQILFVAETGQPLVSAVIRPQAEDRRMAMLLSLPHGLYFPPGLTITIDQGEATTVAIQTSDQKGAYAAMPLTDDLVAAMKLGKRLNIAMRFADGRDEVVPLTLAGFTSALEKLTSLL
jgi:invasion protein IalB